MARLTFILPAILCAFHLHAQEADRAIRKGNSDLEKGNLKGAIEAYSKAARDERGMFNLGNAYYRQDSAALAQRTYENAAAMAKGEKAQARAYHNLGNSWMRQGKYQEAVNAYKEALKRTPNDKDTRYNLAYAQKKLAKQQQQQKQDKNNDQKNKDKNKDKQKKDQNKGDQKNKDKDQQDKDKQGDEQKKDQQKKQDQQQGDQKKSEQQKQRQDRINPQDAKRMLDAAQQQEKEVQRKVREMMQPKKAKPTEKDW